MNDLENLVPLAAKVVGVSPSTLLLALGLLHLAAKVTARLIPDDKTGILGSIRKAAGVIGVEPSSRITDGVSIKDVATAAIAAVPEVAQKVADPST
jgi:hypothetical protein